MLGAGEDAGLEAGETAFVIFADFVFDAVEAGFQAVQAVVDTFESGLNLSFHFRAKVVDALAESAYGTIVCHGRSQPDEQDGEDRQANREIELDIAHHG